MAEPKELKVKEQQTTFVKGEHSNDAVVVTSPKTTVVNLPYVEDVKEIAKANAGSGSGGESEWEQKIKEVLVYNETDEQVECGTDLEVDGKVKINDLQQITDTDGDPIIPDPTGHVGEVLYHTTTGYGWKAAGEGTGTQLYKHVISAVLVVEDETMDFAAVVISTSNVSLTQDDFVSLSYGDYVSREYKLMANGSQYYGIGFYQTESTFINNIGDIVPFDFETVSQESSQYRWTDTHSAL